MPGYIEMEKSVKYAKMLTEDMFGGIFFLFGLFPAFHIFYNEELFDNQNNIF